MASAGELKSINNAMEGELKAKNFNSPNIISNLKRAKVTRITYRSPSIVSLTSNISQRSIFKKQVEL